MSDHPEGDKARAALLPTHTMEVLALIVLCSIPLTFFMRTKTEAPPATAAGAAAH